MVYLVVRAMVVDICAMLTMRQSQGVVCCLGAAPPHAARVERHTSLSVLLSVDRQADRQQTGGLHRHTVTTDDGGQ